MQRFFYISLLLIFVSCGKDIQENKGISAYLPENAEVVLISSNFENFKNQLETNPILSKSQLDIENSFSQKFNFFQHLDSLTGELAVSFSEIKQDSYTYTITSNANWGNINLDSVKSKSQETVKSGDLAFKKYNLEGNIFYLYHEKGIFTLTNSQNHLLRLIKEERFLKDPNFDKALKASDPNVTSVFINHEYATNVQKYLFPNIDIPNLENYASWTVLDLDLDNGSFNFNGISISDPENLQQVFQNIEALPVELGAIAPTKSKGFFSFTYSNFKELHSALRRYNKDSLNIPYPPFLDFTREMGILYYKESKILTLVSLDAESLKEKLYPLSEKTKEYRGLKIYKMEDPSIFRNRINPLLKFKEAKFYCIVDQFLIFAEEESILEELVSSYQNRDVLSEQTYYQNMLAELSSESTMLFVSNFPQFKTSLSAEARNAIKKDIESLNLKNVQAFALQTVQEKNFAHLHGVTAYAEDNSTVSMAAASQSLSINLDTDLATPPFFFKNHRSGQLDIAVQDKNNLLYLISNKGEIFWKKQLDARITGAIHQVDILKNGKYQLAFSTMNSFEVIDRNGNTVKPFPIKFKDELTQPVAIFDYDNTRNYRFVLTQKNRLFMLDSKGKAIKGFDFDRSQTDIIKPPKHIRLGTKDYILVHEASGKLNILSRQGTIRVPLAKKISPSEMPWFGYKNQFISTDEAGNLIKIDQKGTISSENLQLAENHKIDADSNNLTYLSENKLNINGKSINLDFGLYTEPKLFGLKNNTYISITDTQTQKVYVFNANAELLPGFPVYGNSIMDIANADTDNKMELVVTGAAGELIIYQF